MDFNKKWEKKIFAVEIEKTEIIISKKLGIKAFLPFKIEEKTILESH